MNLKNIRILCSIDRQIKVKLGGGEAYLDGQGGGGHRLRPCAAVAARGEI